MLRKITLVLVLLAALGVTVEHAPKPAFGQTGSTRLLSTFYALVGETVYHVDHSSLTWRALPHVGQDLPPVPASSLIALESGVAVTDAGEGWIRLSSGWQSIGTIPGVTTVNQSTWGALKAKYR